MESPKLIRKVWTVESRKLIRKVFTVESPQRIRKVWSVDCAIPTTFEEGLDSGFSTTY